MFRCFVFLTISVCSLLWYSVTGACESLASFPCLVTLSPIPCPSLPYAPEPVRRPKRRPPTVWPPDGPEPVRRPEPLRRPNFYSFQCMSVPFAELPDLRAPFRLRTKTDKKDPACNPSDRPKPTSTPWELAAPVCEEMPGHRATFTRVSGTTVWCSHYRSTQVSN